MSATRSRGWTVQQLVASWSSTSITVQSLKYPTPCAKLWLTAHLLQIQAGPKICWCVTHQWVCLLEYQLCHMLSIYSNYNLTYDWTSASLHVWMEHEAISLKRPGKMSPRLLASKTNPLHYWVTLHRKPSSENILMYSAVFFCRCLQQSTETHSHMNNPHQINPECLMHSYIRLWSLSILSQVNLLTGQLLSVSWKSVQEGFWEIPKNWYLVNLPYLPVLCCS